MLTIAHHLTNQLCQSYFEGEQLPPISTPWAAYSSTASHSALHFKLYAIMTNLPYTGRVRNPVVGCETNCSQVVFNVHQSHRHDSTHPSLFYKVGYHSYMWSAAQLCIVTYHTLWSNTGRMVTHPCINHAHDCLTSVIKCEMFAPCYGGL